MKLLPALLLLSLAPALSLPVHAADKAKDKKESEETVAKVNLSEFKFGKTVSGTEVTADYLKGSPVIVEFWGVNCGPCLAAMPMFNSLAKRYDSKGLKIVGAHSQQATNEEILGVVKKLKIKFPVTEGAQHPLNFSGIPHSAVFSADGTMLFEGHPSDKGFEKALREAIKTAPPVDKAKAAEAEKAADAEKAKTKE